MTDYILQAVERGPDGRLLFVCYDSPFVADEIESAVVTANALFEVIPVLDRCNRIEILDTCGNRLWSRPIDASEHGF